MTQTPTTRSAPAPHRRDRWLFAAACLLVLSTFVLVGLGGAVTSNDAGLAVPDGWMTFGVFTPFSPLEDWWHDAATRWEHSHRLKGYVVGFLTLIVAAGLWATAGSSSWRCGLAAALVVMVIAQGVMGAIRVDAAVIEDHGVGVAATGTETPLSTAFRIFHGITGQLFLCLTVLAAAAVGKLWRQATAHGRAPSAVGRRMTRLCFWLWVVFLIQLTLGAAVRHTGSALAIPDFPGHFGGLIPPTSQAALDAELAVRGITQPVALWQVYLHLAHRLFAWVVCAKVVVVVWRVFKTMDWPDEVLAPAITLVSLLVIQMVLGVTVVLSGESAFVATTHQTVGAVLFASAAWLVIRVGLAARTPADAGAPTSPAAAGPAHGTPKLEASAA